MAISFEKVADRVFDLIVGSNRRIHMFDVAGKKVYNPGEARRFFIEPEKIMVAIRESGDNSAIKVYFSEGTNIDDVKKLLGLLRETATHYNLLFTSRKYARSLTPKDFAFQAEIEGKVAEGMNMTQVAEKMDGSTRSSYQQIGDAKVIVRHSGKVDENVIGARGRNIRSLFVENKDGERFKMPSNNLAAARAMARHISSGGSFNDETAERIHGLVNEYRNLSGIARYMKEHTELLDESSGTVSEKIDLRMGNISKSLRRMSGARGYGAIVEQLNETDDTDPKTLEEEVHRLLGSLAVEAANEPFMEGLRSIARMTIRDRQQLGEAQPKRKDDDDADFGALPDSGTDRTAKDDQSLSTALDALMTDNPAKARLAFNPHSLTFGGGKDVGLSAQSRKDASQPPERFASRKHEFMVKLGALAQAVENDSLSVMLSAIHEKLEAGRRLTEHERRVMLRALVVAQHMDDRMIIRTPAEKDKKMTQEAEPEPQVEMAPPIDAEEFRGITEWAESFRPESILRETYQPSEFVSRQGHRERFDEGDTVTVIPTPEINQSAFPEANWLTDKAQVVLRTPAIRGGMDIVEVEMPDGAVRRLYGFNIADAVEPATSLTEDKLWERAMEMVRWKDDPERLRAISAQLEEKDVRAILDRVDHIWMRSVGNALRRQLGETISAEEIGPTERELAASLPPEWQGGSETALEPVDDGSDAAGESIRISEIGDMLAAERALESANVSFEPDYDGNTVTFESREDAETAIQVLDRESIPYDRLTEDRRSYDVLGGTANADFLSDVSREHRAHYGDRGRPSIHSDEHYLLVQNEAVARRAMQVLDEADIDYTAHPPGRFEFRDDGDLEKAINVLEASSVPIARHEGVEAMMESDAEPVMESNLVDFMAHLRKKLTLVEAS